MIHAFQPLKCLKTLENGIRDKLTDQLPYRKSYQMRQKMRKNVPNCCLTLMKYLNLHLSTLLDLKNAKKVKWDRPTDRHSDLLSRVHATKNS